MKKVLIALGILVVVVIVVAIAAPFFIPVETYRTQIEQRVEAATGRKLTIAGPMKLSLLPSVSIDAKDVRFANAPGAPDADMATLAGLEVKVKMMPLLSGNVAIDSFVLDKPVIHLDVDKQGRPNWQFATEPTAKPAPQRQTPAQPSDGASALSALRLDNVQLRDGLITYRDAQSGANYSVEAINVRLSLPDLDSPFRADGGLTWNGKPVKLAIDLTNPRSVMEGKASPVALNVNTDLLRFDFRGDASGGDPMKLDGGIDLDVPNVRGLAAWLGQPLNISGSGLGPLQIKGKIAVAGPQASFTGADMSLDKMRLRGDIMVDSGGKVPYVKAKLDTNTLDLNPYLPPPSKTPPTKSASPPTQSKSQGWSTEPLDFSGLRAADADLELGVQGLRIQKITIGQGRLSVALKDGKLGANLRELALYKGNAKGQVSLDGSGKTPALAVNLSLAGVQAEPLLKDMMDMDRLSGTAQSELHVSGAGASQADLIRALNGKGNLKLSNGSIKGIDLLAMVRNVSSALGGGGQAGGAQQTAFSEFSGTYTIEKGIVRNNDLRLIAPVLGMSGAGTVNLPQRSLNYRIEPKVAGGVPVVVEGPWDNLSYKPDVSGVLKAPQGAVEGLQGIIGGQKSSPSGSGTSGSGSGGAGRQQSQTPGDQLRGLFGR